MAPKPPVTTPAVVVAPPRGPGANWIFTRFARLYLGKLDLGGEGTLYVSADGRRTLVKAGVASMDAPTIVPEPLVGAMRNAAGEFAFVAATGNVYVARSALGPIEATRPGPQVTQRGPAVSVGKTAIVAVTRDLGVVRSTDQGASWVKVAYARSPGFAGSVALDGKGNGLILNVPEPYYVTHDDGATWSPIASPRIGAQRIVRNEDELVLIGDQHDATNTAKLDGDRLVTGMRPAHAFDVVRSLVPRVGDAPKLYDAVALPPMEDRVVGPNGWTFVREGDRSMIKPAGSNAFEPVALSLRWFVFDEAHDKVWAIAEHDRHPTFYESSLHANQFALVEPQTVTESVDEKGLTRTFEHEDSRVMGWTIHRRAASGAAMPDLYLPLSGGTTAFAGARGLLMARAPVRGIELWETGDGGDTWIRIGTRDAEPKRFACAPAGCVLDDDVRVGWDLPVVKNAETVKVATTPQLEIDYIGGWDGPPFPKLTLRCTVSGPRTRLQGLGVPTPFWSPRAPNQRWTFVGNNIVVGERSTTRTFPIPGAASRLALPGATLLVRGDDDEFSRSTLTSAGYVSARIVRSKSADVNVTLDWFSFFTHKTISKTLPTSFAVVSGDVEMELTNAGLLFQGEKGKPVGFVGEDGKIDLIPFPTDVHLCGCGDGVTRAAGRWWRASSDALHNLVIGSSSDGQSWTKRTWTAGLEHAPEVAEIGSKAMLVVTHPSFADSFPGLLLPLDPALPDMPPPGMRIDLSSVDPTCDARASVIGYHQNGGGDAIVIAADPKNGWNELHGSSRNYELTAQGRMCTTSFTAFSQGLDQLQQAFLYPERDGSYTGWRFRYQDEARFTDAEPMTCNASK